MPPACSRRAQTRPWQPRLPVGQAPQDQSGAGALLSGGSQGCGHQSFTGRPPLWPTGRHQGAELGQGCERAGGPRTPTTRLRTHAAHTQHTTYPQHTCTAHACNTESHGVHTRAHTCCPHRQPNSPCARQHAEMRTHKHTDTHMNQTPLHSIPATHNDTHTHMHPPLHART